MPTMLCSMLPMFFATVYGIATPMNTRPRVPSVDAMPASAVVSFRHKPWDNPPGESKRACWIEAKCSKGNVGRCGLEVVPVTSSGLTGDSWDHDVRPRAVLSGELFVEKRFRRQGVAQQLIREAETRARWGGCGELLLIVKSGNTAALRLYEKLGYTRHKVTKYHGKEVCMSRHLFMPNAHTLLSIAPQLTRVR